ncbi:MAG: 3'-5' exonuclease [Bacillota bacterium]|nr:3'-5' exonuclease [Bacillota bacterium]
MNYIVFDLEWNSAGRANKVTKAIQDAIPFEIIEIGAVKLNSQFEVIGKFSTQIKPRIYPILTGPVAAVTRRHQQSMKYGLDFRDAARDFLAFCGQDYLFCTWSESDTATLIMNLRYYGMADQLEVLCLDVQYLFDMIIEQADIQRSIEYAVDFLNIPKQQPFHQAVHDAYYTGQIFRQIVAVNVSEQNDIDLIARYAFDPNLNRSYQFYLSNLPDTAAVVAELDQQAATCPACGTLLQQEQEWTLEKNKLTALFACPEHGQITGKSRLHRKNGDLVSAAVTIRINRDQDSSLITNQLEIEPPS